jgi:hypothetical protein
VQVTVVGERDEPQRRSVQHPRPAPLQQAADLIGTPGGGDRHGKAG